MTDASDVYRRFVEAPLRLKTRTPSPSPPYTPPPSTQQHDPTNPSPWADSPAFSTRSKEVQRLRRRVAKVTISTADAEIPTDPDNTSDVADVDDQDRSAGASSGSSQVANKDESKASTSLLRKKKRVTRSVTVKDQDTGAEFVDTPTKASKPPKRMRKFSRDMGSKQSEKKKRSVFSLSLDGADSDDEKERGGAVKSKGSSSAPRRRISVTVMVPVRRSRRLQHIKAESPKPEKEASDATTSSNSSPEQTRVPPVEPVDSMSDFCDSLLATNTISGCFFALSLDALRDLQSSVISKSTSGEADPFESVFAICLGIAECEKLAQCSFPSKSPKAKSPKTPPVVPVGQPTPRRRVSLKQAKKAGKSVRFRSFDLSCLNLQYVDDEQVAGMVERILTRYGIIMDHVEKMLAKFDAEAGKLVQEVLRELARMMASPSEIYDSSRSSADAAGASKKIYRRAYGARDLYSQHEIRTCGEYFARQFSHLLAPRASVSSRPQFLHGVFSSLASSTIRFKLRVLFIESEDFGEDVSGGDGLHSRVLLDEGGNPFPAMAPYEHQDLGAAIHWALQESVLYWPLVKPLFEMLEGGVLADGQLDDESPVMEYLDENDAEDLDHMEKYVLARRFLRFHLTKSWRHRLKGDNDAAATWASIEMACKLAKRCVASSRAAMVYCLGSLGMEHLPCSFTGRLRFEDEVHLYPLASGEEFIDELTREEPTLQRMEEALQSFYEQKYGKARVLKVGLDRVQVSDQLSCYLL
jgi:hypothetical protein